MLSTIVIIMIQKQQICQINFKAMSWLFLLLCGCINVKIHILNCYSNVWIQSYMHFHLPSFRLRKEKDV